MFGTAESLPVESDGWGLLSGDGYLLVGSNESEQITVRLEYGDMKFAGVSTLLRLIREGSSPLRVRLMDGVNSKPVMTASFQVAELDVCRLAYA